MRRLVSFAFACPAHHTFGSRSGRKEGRCYKHKHHPTSPPRPSSTCPVEIPRQRNTLDSNVRPNNQSTDLPKKKKTPLQRRAHATKTKTTQKKPRIAFHVSRIIRHTVVRRFFPLLLDVELTSNTTQAGDPSVQKCARFFYVAWIQSSINARHWASRQDERLN